MAVRVCLAIPLSANSREICRWKVSCIYQGMLLGFALIMLLLWILGMVTSTTLYGFLHLFLIVAVAAFLIGVIEDSL